MSEEKIEQQQKQEKILIRKIYYKKDKVWALEMQVDTWDLNGNKSTSYYPIGTQVGTSFVESKWKNQKELHNFLKKKQKELSNFLEKKILIIDSIIIIKE